MIGISKKQNNWPLCLFQIFCSFGCKLRVQRVGVRGMRLWIGKMEKFKGSEFLLDGYLTLDEPKEMRIGGCSFIPNVIKAITKMNIRWRKIGRFAYLKTGYSKWSIKRVKRKPQSESLRGLKKDVSFSCSNLMIFTINTTIIVSSTTSEASVWKSTRMRVITWYITENLTKSENERDGASSMMQKPEPCC